MWWSGERWVFICLELQCDSCRLFRYVTIGVKAQQGCLKVTRSAVLTEVDRRTRPKNDAVATLVTRSYPTVWKIPPAKKTVHCTVLLEMSWCFLSVCTGRNNCCSYHQQSRPVLRTAPDTPTILRVSSLDLLSVFRFTNANLRRSFTWELAPLVWISLEACMSMYVYFMFIGLTIPPLDEHNQLSMRFTFLRVVPNRNQPERTIRARSVNYKV